MDENKVLSLCQIYAYKYFLHGSSLYLLMLEPPGHVLRSQLGWLPLGVRAEWSLSEDQTLGPGT